MHKLRGLIGILLIFCFVILLGCTSIPGGGSETKGIIKGKIYDQETNRLITEQVRATLVTVQVIFPVGGEYAFNPIVSGNWIVMIEAVGYHTERVELKLKPGETKIVDIYLKPKPEIPPPSVEIPLVLVPGASSFPVGLDDQETCSEVNYPYLVGQYQVTYELWRQVYDWATNEARGFGQYFFAKPGRPGSGGDDEAKTNQHPATLMTWRDAMVWCNALTEYYNAANGESLECVYTYKSGVVRDARKTNSTACDNVIAGSGDGFRLLTSMEWELAARYIGEDQSRAPGDAILLDGVYWTPGNFASGAYSNWEDQIATGEVAWFYENSGYTTHEVGKLRSNALDIYDMSGNVWELCFDRQDDGNPNHVGRVIRGGAFLNPSQNQRIGFHSYEGPDRFTASVGFRIARR